MTLFKSLSAKILVLEAKLILYLLYFLILPFFSAIDRLLKGKSKSGWSSWQIKSDSLEDLKRQD